jgi:hypothetical protein
MLIVGLSPFPQFTPSISVLFNGLTAHELSPGDAAGIVQWANELRQHVGWTAVLAIARCARWVPVFEELAASLRLIEYCEAALSGSDVAEIQSALIVLSYGGSGLSDRICDLAFNSNEAVAACSLWFIGRHLRKHPEDCQAVISLGLLNVVANAFERGSIRIRTEAALLLARIIEACPEVWGPILPFVFQIGELLAATTDSGLLIPILKGLSKLVAAGIDLSDDELIAGLEAVAEHERVDIAQQAKALLESL